MNLLLFAAAALFGAPQCVSNTPLEPKKHKLYCFYTPLFQPLYEQYFLPSLKDDFEIIAAQFEQECPLGIFETHGWDRTMYRKLQMLREAVLANYNSQIFFYSDVDVIFLQPILKEALYCLGEHDLAIQQGWPGEKICAGFMVLKGGSRTLAMIDMALRLMEEGTCLNDQAALRACLELLSKEELSWRLLPPLQFPNGKRVLKEYRQGVSSLYTKEASLAIDASILLFHANCCIGLENKIDFIRRIQEEYLKKQATMNFQFRLPANFSVHLGISFLLIGASLFAGPLERGNTSSFKNKTIRKTSLR